jgi:hypothetical protein
MGSRRKGYTSWNPADCAILVVDDLSQLNGADKRAIMIVAQAGLVFHVTDEISPDNRATPLLLHHGPFSGVREIEDYIILLQFQKRQRAC